MIDTRSQDLRLVRLTHCGLCALSHGPRTRGSRAERFCFPRRCSGLMLRPMAPVPASPPSHESRPKRIAAAATTWCLLTLMVAALALELDVAPHALEKAVNGWAAPWDDLPSGIWAAAAVGLGILVAPLAHATRQVVAAALSLFASIFSLALVALGLPETASSYGGVGHVSALALLWIRIPLWLAVLLVLSRLLLLQRFSAIRAEERPERSLLSHQLAALESLKHILEQDTHESGGRIVQLKGRWGEGKSVVLDTLVRDLEPRSTTLRGAVSAWRGRRAGRKTVVFVDVWKYESEWDLHTAILHLLLGSPAYLYPFGWLRYSASALLDASIQELRLEFGPRGGRVHLPFSLPRLPRQGTLERLAARSRRRRVRTVIVLDEIDRASSQMTQTALTLMRRSLDLPGITVVLSFVEDTIRYKAFNPLLPQLSDLRSQTEAVLFDHFFNRPSGRDESIAEVWTNPAHGSIRGWWGWPTDVSLLDDVTLYAARLQPATHGSSGSDTYRLRYAEEVTRLQFALRDGYAGMSVTDRLLVERRVSEKFLSTAPVVFGAMADSDVGDMLVSASFGPLRAKVAAVLDEPEPPGEVLAGMVVGALDAWRQQMAGTVNLPPVRQLEAELYRYLDHIDAWGLRLTAAELVLVVVSVVDELRSLGGGHRGEWSP